LLGVDFGYEKGATMSPTALALLGPIGLPELIIVFMILLLIFGANRLSGLGKGLGQAIRGFKDEVSREKTPNTARKD